MITAVNEDGTCSIKYHDGVEEENYGAKRLAIILDIEADGEDFTARSKSVSKPVATKKAGKKRKVALTALPGRAKSKRKRTAKKMDGE